MKKMERKGETKLTARSASFRMKQDQNTQKVEQNAYFNQTIQNVCRFSG